MARRQATALLRGGCFTNAVGPDRVLELSPPAAVMGRTSDTRRSCCPPNGSHRDSLRSHDL